MKFQPFLVLIICSLLILSGCEKRLFDYRNKYTGDYNVTYYYQYWQMNLGVYETNTLELTGKVFYDKKGERDEIVIQFNGENRTFQITKKGKLMLCETQVGAFSDRKHFYLNYSSGTCPGGGMGGGANYTLTASRK